jgi:photosystem II stability/assembly factor-like uncharacterized protein
MKTNKITLLFLLIFLISPYLYSQNEKWSRVLFNDTLEFVGIDNPDSNYCMAVANLRSPAKGILKSTDAGDTWNYVYYENLDFNKWYTYKDPFDIAYPTTDFCVVSCDSNTLFRTRDGGKTWQEIRTYDLPFAYRGFFQINMLDSLNGLAVNHFGLALTHNGFDSMEIIPNPNGYLIYCAYLAAPNSICVVSYNKKDNPDFNKFYRSDNGGKTWNEYPFPDFTYPNRMKFVDSLTGYLAGGKDSSLGNTEYDLVYKTTDGGKTWFNVLDTFLSYNPFGLQKLDFYDKDNGIIVGQFGTIIWTHDGGKTWIFDTSSKEMTVEYAPTLNVCYIRKDRAIIVDFVGRIFISSDDTTDVEENPILNNEEIYISPNPASEFIKLRLPLSSTHNTNAKIYNSFGQEIEAIKQKRINEIEFGLDVSPLPNGVYFALITSQGKIYSKPFVVMR